MNPGDGALRDALAASADDVPVSDACPDPALLWDAARAELPGDRLGPVLDHLAGCGACVEAWRLAREVQEPVRTRAPWRARRSWIAGGAAVLAAAAAVVLLIRRGSGPAGTPPYRGERSPILSRVDDGARLPRDRFVLSWVAAGPGARYRLAVYTEELDPIDEAVGLDTTTYQVPAARLKDLAPGARLSWRVEATLGSGAVVRSHTFVVRLE